MVSPSHLKPLQSLHVFSMKPSPSSTLSSMKIKTMIHTLVFSHVCRMARALTKAKSILIEILKDIQLIHFTYPLKKNKHKKKMFGSFRLHYNWCSSHVLPVPSSRFYYDSTWNSIISTEQCEEGGESQLSGYLHWLEEKVHDKSSTSEADSNEIDKLADMFIANCHEKFRLEKQESYRRFQEMMARSV
ncbi:hypothetical protein L1049_008942 [Liquidambar formosana]|uniref:DUF761 domain-containing protein n=1 Tax=Liquidambar formosana TaxID=63359 RepID=A0AAP0S3S2_LIQFO